MKIRKPILVIAHLVALMSSAAPVVSADTPGAVRHSAPSELRAGEPVPIRVAIERDWELESVWLSVRTTASSGAFEELPMLRTPDNLFRATVPAELVQPPLLEYFIDVVPVGAPRETRFASAAEPFPVPITGETEQMRVADRLARHNGNRSSLRSWGDVTLHGTRPVEGLDSATDRGSDRFWTANAKYRHRLLGLVYDIHFGIGFMRDRHDRGRSRAGRWSTRRRARSELGVRRHHAGAPPPLFGRERAHFRRERDGVRSRCVGTGPHWTHRQHPSRAGR